jgi:quercetin dioxygenase-like cupin family protein
MEQKMQLVALDALDPSVPDGHWGVASRFIEQGEQLTVQLCEMARDGGAEPHVHEAQDQMFIVLDGALTVRGDGAGEDLVVGAGEALRIPAGAAHATVSAAAGSTRYLVLTYPAAQAR